jgi:hypothetical protein
VPGQLVARDTRRGCCVLDAGERLEAHNLRVAHTQQVAKTGLDRRVAALEVPMQAHGDKHAVAEQVEPSDSTTNSRHGSRTATAQRRIPSCPTNLLCGSNRSMYECISISGEHSSTNASMSCSFQAA